MEPMPDDGDLKGPIADVLFEEFEVVPSSPDPLRVLLIEDDPDHAALVEAYLAEVRDPMVDLSHAETAAGGISALSAARAEGHPYHAVLTDQQLPDSDYWETVGRVVAEVGIAMMLGGNIRGYTRTLSTAIALETAKGEFGFGIALGIILMPVVALTSLGEMEVALDAVRAGASDYLVKAELTPELLRRTLRSAVERVQRDEALRSTNEALRRTLKHARRMQAQIVEQEKLAGLGRLLSGVAHEIRNPLGLAVNSAEAIVSETTGLVSALADTALPAATREMIDSVRELAESVARNGRRADATVRSMYAHARGVEGRAHTIQLPDAVRVAMAQMETGSDAVEVNAADVQIRGVASALVRMLANLMENACLAAGSTESSPSGRVRVTVREGVGQVGQAVAEITIEDDGPGWMLDMESALRPFVSTWPEHLGLGLPMAQAIAVSHEGRLHLGTSDLGGALVCVTLPLYCEPAATEAA